MNNFYKWTYIVLIFIFILIYIYEAVIKNKEKKEILSKQERLYDIDLWPNLKFDIKFVWHFLVLFLTAIVIGICSGFLFHLEKFIPIPELGYVTSSLEDDILPAIFSFLTIFLWNYLRKSFEWCLTPFSIFSRRVFITIVVVWVTVGSYFAMVHGAKIYRVMVSNLPEAFVPLHLKIKVGDVIKNGELFYLVREDNNVFELNKNSSQMFQVGRLVSDASSVSWWWNKTIVKNDQRFSAKLMLEENANNFRNESIRVKSIWSFISIIFLIYWIVNQYFFVFINANHIWWVNRYKNVLKIDNALKLFALYNSRKKDFDNWISINLLSKHNADFVLEVMQQLKIISNQTENESENSFIQKTMQVVNLQPPIKRSFWLTDLIKKINTIKEDYF